jgi:hypothetical protein
MPSPDLEAELLRLRDELDLVRTRSEAEQLIDRHVEVFRKLRPAARKFLLEDVVFKRLRSLPE